MEHRERSLREKPTAEARRASPAAHEALIRARCRATLTESGALDRITEVLDFELLDSPDRPSYRPKKIKWGNKVFLLNQELRCRVSAEDSLWVVEYKPLGIRACGSSQEDAVAEFNEEFAMLWDEFRHAPDSSLTRDAIALKRRLTDLVREVSVE